MDEGLQAQNKGMLHLQVRTGLVLGNKKDEGAQPQNDNGYKQ